MLPRSLRLTPFSLRQLSRSSSSAIRVLPATTSSSATIKTRTRTTPPSFTSRRFIQCNHGNMSVNKACCSIPPAQASGYVAKGEYKMINGLKTYVTGPEDATDALLVIYDIFGFYPQTIQGADIISTSDPEHHYRVFMPDFFNGEPAELAWFPPTDDDKKSKLSNFFATKATPQTHTARIPHILAEANKLAPNKEKFRGWGVLGYCWGGKITTLVSGEGSFFKCGIQCHPAMLDAEDAKKITIPYATLASKDEDGEVVKAFDGNLKGEKYTETFGDQIHGWMAARSDLSDERVKKEYERGYKTVVGFLHQYM